MRHDRSASPDREAGPQYSAPHPAQRIRTARRSVHLGVAIGLSLLTLGLGVVALIYTPPGDTAAIWWPAAGTGVLLILLFRGPIWIPFAVIAATGLLANLVVGRAVEFSIATPILLVLEALIVVLIVGRHGEHARLDHVRGLGRFFVAAIAGALSVALLGALIHFALGGDEPVGTGLALFLSHLSALLLMAPIALVPFSRRPLMVKPARIAEGIVQFTVTLALAGVIFSPVLPVPVLFTLFPLLAWAAARFRPLYVVAQLAAIALLIPALNIALGGPYRDMNGIDNPGELVQLFMICAAITTNFLAVGRSEREALLDDRERRTALLRGGFIGSQVGFLVLRRSADGSLSIVEANDVGYRMSTDNWLEDLLERWLKHPENDLTQEVTLENGRSFQVFASLAGATSAADDGDMAVGVQLVEITDTIAARDALARTLERERAVTVELRELARQKDVFVSAVSHELRTPITSILGFAEEIDDTGSAETKQAAQIILRNSQRLAEMVEQLLELGRLADPETHRSVGTSELDPVVIDTIDEQRRTAERAGITIQVSTGDGVRRVGIERLSLGRVLTNLLSNAIKFTPSGGTVRVETRVRAHRGIITVDDSGVGIEEADRDRVFDRFFRASDEAKLAMPGTGLGLPIVKALVESAGGQVTIDESPLGGTRFTVELPLASRHDATAPDVPVVTEANAVG